MVELDRSRSADLSELGPLVASLVPRIKRGRSAISVSWHRSRLDGHPYLDPSDFSFSVLARTVASPPGEGLFDVRAEFHYDSMPVQLQQMLDASLPAGNNSLVTMKRRVPKESPSSEELTYSGGQGYQLSAYEASSASFTRSEVLQIVGLGIACAQLAVMVF